MEITVERCVGVMVSSAGEFPDSLAGLADRASALGRSLLKQGLVESIDAVIEKGRRVGVVYPTPDSYLVIMMPCGSHVNYATPDDIPEVDVPCPCGDPHHWLLKYEGGGCSEI